MRILSIILLLLLVHSTAEAVTFEWDPHEDETVIGFMLYKSKVSGQYTYGQENAVAIIPNGTHQAIIEDPGSYYWVVTAYNDDGESLPSNEVVFGLTKRTVIIY